MKSLSRHFTRTLISGIVALLPIVGLVLGAVWAENSVAESWLADQQFYFPGMGIVGVLVITYLVGLGVTTFVGRALWRIFDSLIDSLPALGMLYRTLKQILGYGEGKDALFERVVLVEGREGCGSELGLVTRSLPASVDAGPRLVVFLPASPTPTSGRVVLVEEERTEPVPMSVHEALRFLVAAGKLEPDEARAAGWA